MINQKGIVWIPILIWSVVLLFTGIALKEGLINIDLGDTKNLAQKANTSPTLTPNAEILKMIKDSAEATAEPKPTSPTKLLIKNESNVKTSRTSGDGSRSGKIVAYKEYCSGKQISVYENEIIVKDSPVDGITYGMTKGDWDCYTANPVVNCNIRPDCGGGMIQMKKLDCEQSICCRVGDRWITYPNGVACTQAQNDYSSHSSTYPYIPPILPIFQIQPLPAIDPYQPSHEYLDSLNNFNSEISKKWEPSPFVVPSPKCYSTWDDYFKAHPYAGNAPIYGKVNMSGTPPCD